MTADELALLRGVEAAPDDDLPRLVYADWLDEHGRHARAEFIRVQCERASIERRLPGMSHNEKTEAGPRRGDLLRRQREMLKTSHSELLPVSDRTPWDSGDDYYSESFERGFLSDFRIYHFAEEFDRAIQMCAGLLPRPRISVEGALAALLSPDLRATFLLRGVWTEVDAINMLDHSNQTVLPHELIPMMQPEYPRLRVFSAYMMQLNPGHVCVIAERLRAPNLERIYLAVNDIVDSGVAFLHRAVYARSLREIDLSSNPICRPEISKLTKDRFPSLQKVNLTDCPIMPQSLAQLREQLPGVEVIC